jgi:hypothetical protein
MSEEFKRDLLEIVDDRLDTHSALVTSQVPFDGRHPWLDESTLADTVLGRLAHNPCRFDLKGESMRRAKVALSPRRGLTIAHLRSTLPIRSRVPTWTEIAYRHGPDYAALPSG